MGHTYVRCDKPKLDVQKSQKRQDFRVVASLKVELRPAVSHERRARLKSSFSDASIYHRPSSGEKSHTRLEGG